MNSKILFEKKGYKAYLTLNKPEKLNVLDMDMYNELLGHMQKLRYDPDIRVIILKANGRAFSAGYDINDETDMDMSPLDERNGFQEGSNKLRWLMWDMDKPVISQVQGHCLGGGIELVLPSDFIIAAEDANLGEPQIQFGAPTVFLMVPWLTGIRKGKELMMTGETISGIEAEKCGLITKAVPLEKLEEEVEALADKLIRIDPTILYIQKLGINRQFEIMGMRTGLETWVDYSMFFRTFRSEEIETFNKIVGEKGVKAALKWKEDLYSEKE